MKKNIIIAIIIIIIIAILAAAFYWFYLKPVTQIKEEVATSDFSPSGGVLPTITASPPSLPLEVTGPAANQPTLKILVNKEIMAFWQSATSSLQYLTKEGLFEINYLNSPPTEEKKELNVNFFKILSIQPSLKGKVLIKYLAEGATKPAYSVLDINTREVKNLDLYIKSATWSPDGEALFYYYSDSPLYYQENFKESSYLAQLDKNLANRKIIMDFKTASDIELLWPAVNTIYLTQKPSGLVETTVLTFDVKNKIFIPFVSGYGLVLKWDDKGQYGLLFTTPADGSKPKLQLINKDGYVLSDFPAATLPEKCVFAHSKPLLYCSIFVNPVFSGVWPDAYYMGAASFNEMIYEINLETMEAKPLNDNVFEVSDIKISNDDRFLFFFDEKNQTLFSLSLPEVVEPTPIPTSPTLTPSPTR